MKFVVENDRTTISPVRTGKSIRKICGALPAFSGVHEVIAWVQILRDEKTQEQ